MKQLFLLIILLVCIRSVESKPNTKNHFSTDSEFIYDLCVSQHGKVVVCTDDLKVKAFDVNSKKLLAEFVNGHKRKILSVALSPDSTIIVSGGRDSTVVIWNAKTHTIVNRLNFPKGVVCDLEFSPDGKFLVIACTNSSAYLYSVIENKCIRVFENLQSHFITIAFSANGNFLALSGDDKTIKTYETADFVELQHLKGHKKEIRSIAFYNNDRNIISCGDDGRIIKWNVSDINRYKIEEKEKSTGWNLCLDIERNSRINYSFYVVGNFSGKLHVYSFFKKYYADFDVPVNKVKILARNNGVIEVMVATLGKGMMKVTGDDLK